MLDPKAVKRALAETFERADNSVLPLRERLAS